jgi:hypothetical protein
MYKHLYVTLCLEVDTLIQYYEPSAKVSPFCETFHYHTEQLENIELHTYKLIMGIC